jgi:hypothetical protein
VVVLGAVVAAAVSDDGEGTPAHTTAHH